MVGRAGIRGFDPRLDGFGIQGLRDQPDEPASPALNREFEPRRRPKGFREAAVASSSRVASATAEKVLRQGGNAIDAAVAASAVLSVAQPMMCGVGGDVFALIWLERSKTVHALNGSGRSPADATIASLRALGHQSVPETGPLPVTVPGAVAAWHEALRRCGTMALDRLLRFAISHASDGLPVDGISARSWRINRAKLARSPANSLTEFFPTGKTPAVGDTVTLPQIAATLKVIADEGPDAFYQGVIAEMISSQMRAWGGWLRRDDLGAHQSEWVEPLDIVYREAKVLQCPPNSQGIATLIGLDIAGRHDMSEIPLGDPHWFEVMVTAARTGLLVAVDRVGDPSVSGSIPVVGHPEMRMIRRPSAGAGGSSGGDTAYVAVMDAEGNGCSMISSLYHDFGSGLVVPGTGIVLNNRGCLFAVDEASPNALAPRKRPYHTIMPCMVIKDDGLSMLLGVVGGFQQPQAQLQILSHLIDYGLHPQDALNRLRFRLDIPTSEGIFLEEGIPDSVKRRLAAYNPRYVIGADRIMFGGAQAIVRSQGAILAASDPRSDGGVAGW